MGLPAEFSRAGDSIRANDFNANVSAVRAAQVMDSAGMMISRNPMGGTTVSPVPPHRMIRSKTEFIIAPFTLRVVNEGSKTSPLYRKLFYYPEGSCDVGGGWAQCGNFVYSGEQSFAKDGRWFCVADATGIGTADHLPDESAIEYVYLHVLNSVNAVDDPVRLAIVTNSQKIPEDFHGYETDCICLGGFSVAQGNQKPRVVDQYVTGQVQVYGDLYPFRLNVVNIGTDADPEWVKVYYAAEMAVQIADDYCFFYNRMLPGSAVGNEGWNIIAPDGPSLGSGNVETTFPIADANDVDYAFLHVKFDPLGTTPELQRMACVTCSKKIPAFFNGKENACICIGRFSSPLESELENGVIPIVARQFVTGAVSIQSDEAERPFRIKRVNVGTEDDPEWKTAVYIPSGAVQRDGFIAGSSYVQNECTAITGMPSWYECENDASHQDVYLKLFLGIAKDENDTYSPGVLYYGLSNSYSAPFQPHASDYEKTRLVIFKLGTVNVTTNVAMDYHLGPVNIREDEGGGSTGGGGGASATGDVIVLDKKSNTAEIPVKASESTTNGVHTVTFELYDLLGIDKIGVQDLESETVLKLTEYLSGSADVTISENNLTTELGKNVNTKNFADECLADSDAYGSDSEETPYEDDIDGDRYGVSKYAARTDHKHLTDEIFIYNEDAEAYEPITKYLQVLTGGGALEDPENDPGYGEEGYVPRPITTSAVNWDDPTMLMPDDEEGNPGGGAAEDDDGNPVYLLALADHVHPLNVTPATVHNAQTDKDEPNTAADLEPDVMLYFGASGIDGADVSDIIGSASYYARADHKHRLPIAKDGEISFGRGVAFRADGTLEMTPATAPLAPQPFHLVSLPIRTYNQKGELTSTTYKKLIYLPSDSVFSFENGVLMGGTVRTGENVAKFTPTSEQLKILSGDSDKWYELTFANLTDVYCVIEAAGSGTLVRFRISNTRPSLSQTDVNITHIGRFSTAGDRVESQIYEGVNWHTNATASPSGGGTEVTVTNGTGAAASITVASAGSGGSVTLTTYQSLQAAKVLIAEGNALSSFFTTNHKLDPTKLDFDSGSANDVIVLNSSKAASAKSLFEEAVSSYHAPLVKGANGLLREIDLEGNEYLDADCIAIPYSGVGSGSESGLTRLSGYFTTGGLIKADIIGLQTALTDQKPPQTLVCKPGEQLFEQVDACLSNPTSDSQSATGVDPEDVVGSFGDNENGRGVSPYAAHADHKHKLEEVSGISGLFSGVSKTVTLGIVNSNTVPATPYLIRWFLKTTFDPLDTLCVYVRPPSFDKYGRFVGLGDEVKLPNFYPMPD